MGKKTKIGKQRKDKFYHLAKETGYRSRAAFKLIQLNRKYEFLQSSRVLIDLCAAPGGWCQVAKQFMPVSSIILGVDLAPIKPIHNVITLQDDITTDHCRQAIRHELKTWNADVVLHDGAPNVGKNWHYDAFTQARLTLSAFKLATDFLTKGGWFITKVFRSKDYNSLLWVFQQFFKKVDATKPPASRTESAEIFVVCKGYLKPDKIDPKFLDPRNVFEDVDGIEGEDVDDKDKSTKGAAKLRILMEPKQKKKAAEGYAEGKILLVERLNARQYIDADEDKSKELLANCNEIVIDDDDKEIAGHPATDEEIRECCTDIKVLGKRELRLLMAWRKKILATRLKAQKAEKKAEEAENPLVSVTQPVEDEDALLQKQIEKLQEDERLEAKRKRKRLNKLRKQLNDRMNLKMVIPGDKLLQEVNPSEESLFSLATIKSSKALEAVDAGEEAEKMEIDSDSDEEDHNPLLVEAETKKSRRERMAEEWFKKDIFSKLDMDGPVIDKKPKKEKNDVKMMDGDEWKSDDESGLGSESDDESDLEFDVIKDDEAKPEVKDEKPVVKLDAEGFALAEELIKSKKRKREIVEAAYHRFAFVEPDETLPTWFVEDEKKFCRKSAIDRGLVTKEQVQAHKERLKEIDARPIRKVAEAQARKKRRAVKRLEKARKKAGKLLNEENEGPGLSQQEKMSQLKAIYKKAGAVGKKKSAPPTYVVAKKGGGLGRSTKEAGKGGKVKIVDKRMKKDLKRNKGGKKGKKGAKGAKGAKSGKRPKR